MATVSNTAGSQGLVTGTGAGTSTITATLGAVTGSTVVTVTGASLVSIDITPSTPSVAKGIVVPFTATGTYSDASTFNITTLVTWTSSTVATAVVSNTPGSQGVASTVNAGNDGHHGHVGQRLRYDDADRYRGDARVDRRAADEPEHRQGHDAAVYGDRHLYRHLHPGHHHAGDLGHRPTPASVTISNAVGSEGLATGLNPGTTTISATLNSISASTTLTVTNATLVSIGITPPNPTIARGTDRQFTATGTYTDLQHAGHHQCGDVELVEQHVCDHQQRGRHAKGSRTARTWASVTITASLGTVSGVTNLTVTAATLVSIQLTPPTPSIPKGTTQQFIATGTYTDTTTQDLTELAGWSSSNGGVATVSGAAGSRGLATGNGNGSALISASYSGVAGSTTLTVTAATLVSIAVTPINQTIAAGTTQAVPGHGDLQRLVDAADHHPRDLGDDEQLPSPPSATPVGAEGLATGVAAGEVDVTATMPGAHRRHHAPDRHRAAVGERRR